MILSLTYSRYTRKDVFLKYVSRNAKHIVPNTALALNDKPYLLGPLELSNTLNLQSKTQSICKWKLGCNFSVPNK